MKNNIKTILLFIAIVSGYGYGIFSADSLYASTQDGVVGLVIIAQSGASVNESIYITVQAVDKNQNIVPGYRGSIIFNTDALGDSMPSIGDSMIFTANDNGVKKFPKGVTFKEPGQRKLFVSDVTNDLNVEKIFTIYSGSQSSSSTASTSQTNSSSINELSNEISSINASITGAVALSSAPSLNFTTAGITYTPWELLHRMPMLAGFMWSGEITKYITPKMFLGTPFGATVGYLGQASPYLADFKGEPKTYAECVTNESYLSYGLGDRIKATDLEEFKAIAKVCAETFYGSYFSGKSYTTREEFLMMMFTLFGENVGFDGSFTTSGKYISKGVGVDSGFGNVSKKSWYAPYLGLANDLGLLPIEETSWKAAKAISNAEAIELLSLYTAYRMDFQGDSLELGSIATPKAKYNLTFISSTSLTIRAQ